MTQLSHAQLVATYSDGSLDFVEVQFNPTEITFDKGVQVAEIGIPGLDSPLLQFVRGNNERLNLELFFDSTENGTGAEAVSVTHQTDKVYSLLKVEPGGHAPPVCSFVWASDFPGAELSSFAGNQRRNEFSCIVESVRQRFTLFSPQGVPLRATLSVTLREYKTLDAQLEQLNLSSPERTHSHLTQGSDTLGRIAARHYRKARAWRAIADANAIEDPRRLEVGRFLVIPPLD